MSLANARLSRFLLFFQLMVLVALPAAAQPERFLPGVHYRDLAQPVLEAGDSEALEFFWYGCAHCYAFEPVLEAWRERHAGLRFVRSPAVWGKAEKEHARLYYSLTALGRLDDLHPALFSAVQQDDRRLLEEGASAAFFARHGISEDRLDSTMGSFAVATALRRDEALYRKVAPPSVPSLLIRGRYLVHASAAVRTHAAMLEVADFLLEKR